MKELLINPWSFDNYTVKKDSQGRATLTAKIMKAGKLKYKTPSGHTFYGKISLDELKKAALTMLGAEAMFIKNNLSVLL